MDDALKEKVIKILPKIREREMMILIMKLGLVDGQPRSSEEVARHFGIAEDKVDKIEAAALKKIGKKSNLIEDIGINEVLDRLEGGRKMKEVGREHFLPRKEEDELGQ